MLPMDTRWANPPQSTLGFRFAVSCVTKNHMPIYEYSCAKCGKTIEVIQKMSDKPLKAHAGCGGKLTKLISAAGFQFKGTGWYVTDYARKSKGESGEGAKDTKGDSKDSSAAAAKDGGSDKSSSDKPAADKGAKPASPPSSSGKTKKS
jgi:putative FmdB family regulatory protein